VSAAVWWAWGALAFAGGAWFWSGLRRFRRDTRPPEPFLLRASGTGDSLDALVAEQQALGHQNLAWPPGTHPPARSHAATDFALWAEEMNQR
jgi:hypothetical protein